MYTLAFYYLENVFEILTAFDVSQLPPAGVTPPVANSSLFNSLPDTRLPTAATTCQTAGGWRYHQKLFSLVYFHRHRHHHDH